MTCNTSAVAVCCSNASRVSVMSRAFSIAMTACAAKFCEQRDLLVRERPDLRPIGDDIAEQGISLRSGTYSAVRTPDRSTVHARMVGSSYSGEIDQCGQAALPQQSAAPGGLGPG